MVGSDPIRGQKKPLQRNVAEAWLDSVGATGFEPATSCSRSRRATGLRYAPKNDLSPSIRGRQTHLNTRSQPTGARAFGGCCSVQQLSQIAKNGPISAYL